jgi:carboxyl-terminal processing protease
MNFKKYINKRSMLVVGILTMATVFFSFKLSDDHNFKIAKNLDIFNAVVKELDMFYVDSLDPDKLVREGIDDMLYSLDPYTNFFPAEDQDELEQMLNGSYGGIGAVISYIPKEKHVMITEPLEGMPAAISGLKCGDYLLSIDGKDLTGKSVEEVSKMLRGQNGTSFKLRVRRPGTVQPLDFTITRRTILTPPVPYYGEVGSHIGYISLSTFSGSPSKDFKQAFLTLKKQGITSLIIDLRDNGGGLLSEAQEIANFFLPRGKVVVTTKGRSSSSNAVYKTLREPLDTNIPIVVLVNGSTASSSEILSGSLQDLDRAVIIGTRTYGKGLVQTPRELPYGGSIKITTSKYYIPSGRCIQAIDYKHRNADGTVSQIPDSLTKLFHTAAGRPVRDGCGILPDVVITHRRVPNILAYLVTDNIIFDYATQYCQKHPKIAPVSDFSISDADYAQFKAFVKRSNFKYDQQSEKILKTLKEAAEFEGYYKDATTEFTSLQKKLSHNLDRDLNYFSKDIRGAIAMEIVKRYYYQRGEIIEQLKDDEDVSEAVKVLGDATRYHRILSPKK